MSTDNQNNSLPEGSRPRRGSVTSAAFTNLFQRSNSTSTGTSAFPGPITTAAMNDQRRRLSVSTVGLSGTSPTNGHSATLGLRRGSMSTNNSDSIDENAVEEDDGRTGPTTPFTRRMSFGAQAMRNLRGSGTSPGTNGRPAPPTRRRSSGLPTPPESDESSPSAWQSLFPTSQASSANDPRYPSDTSSVARTDQGFNWSEQLRSRAESSVAAGSRPSFSFASGFAGSPPRGNGAPGLAAGGNPATGAHHDRPRSVSDLPAPPAQAPKPRADPRPKPDHFQERILKGDFYMD